MIVDAPIEFYITGVEQKIGVEAFENLPVSEQGRHIAYLQLVAMQRLIELHATLQARAKNENRKTPTSRNSTSKRGRSK